MKTIPWWSTKIGRDDALGVYKSIRHKHISQGPVTYDFERQLQELLGVEYVIATASGSSALMLTLVAIGLRPGDEVVVPNRTWIATAHAAHLLGANVILSDVEQGRPIMDAAKLRQVVTEKTKVIIPVHLNGRSANIDAIKGIADSVDALVIEDAAQALCSQRDRGFLGTQSLAGCFSTSMAKLLSTGQGGFVATNDRSFGALLRRVRTHGVENVKDPVAWPNPGFNFRFNDLAASIGLTQLGRLPENVRRVQEIHDLYVEGLAGTPFNSIPVATDVGELPVYNEFLVKNREDWVSYLGDNNIETRSFYPSLNRAKYLCAFSGHFPNSEKFESEGIYLPSGPGQLMSDIKRVIKCIQNAPSQLSGTKRGSPGK
jgi:perosamine synthetase